MLSWQKSTHSFIFGTTHSKYRGNKGLCIHWLTLRTYYVKPCSRNLVRYFTARNEVGARLCFYTCLWFCLQVQSASEHAGIPSPRADSPWEQTPPPEQAPPIRSRSPPQEQTSPPGSSACWDIRATRGWYISYWNAFLFSLKFPPILAELNFVLNLKLNGWSFTLKLYYLLQIFFVRNFYAQNFKFSCSMFIILVFRVLSVLFLWCTKVCIYLSDFCKKFNLLFSKNEVPTFMRTLKL